jgi:putative ABC transport system permease protein
MALGADSRDILRMIMANGLKLVAAGALVGTVVARAAGRVIESQLFGVSATDFATFGAVVAVILLVGVTACLLGGCVNKQDLHIRPRSDEIVPFTVE